MISKVLQKIVSPIRPVTVKPFARPRILKRMVSTTTSVEEKKVEINGVNINYVKVGSGPHHVLCTPGALGSIWTDFKPQVENLNRSQFTMVVWDPPGYGKSVPPKRDFSPGYFHRDADFGYKLMQTLGIEKYSLMGWSNGGTVSIIIASKHPDNIKKMVIWGVSTYTTDLEEAGFKVFRDHSMLNPKLKAPYIALYGEEYYDELWTSWVDSYLFNKVSETKGDICKTLVSKVTCPTFVLHGTKDNNIDGEHPRYIVKNLKNFRLHIFPEGKHNIHMEYSQEFNKLVEDFLLKDTAQSKL